MAKAANQRHLYEIRTARQGEMVIAVLAEERIVEIARLRDFLYPAVPMVALQEAPPPPIRGTGHGCGFTHFACVGPK
jgi:hypothetical protein